MTGPHFTAQPPTAERPAPRSVRVGAHRIVLHQPGRMFRVLGDAVLAALAVAAAVWCWRQGVVVIHYPAADGLAATDATRYLGNWLSGAVALCVLAGLLGLDAVRQLALGVRVRRDRSPG